MCCQDLFQKLPIPILCQALFMFIAPMEQLPTTTKKITYLVILRGKKINACFSSTFFIHENMNCFITTSVQLHVKAPEVQWQEANHR